MKKNRSDISNLRIKPSKKTVNKKINSKGKMLKLTKEVHSATDQIHSIYNSILIKHKQDESRMARSLDQQRIIQKNRIVSEIKSQTENDINETLELFKGL